jgi:hypothetical protein
MASPCPCNVLMIYPRFGAATFWNFEAACELFNAHYPTAPLGLITVAALLPPAWTVGWSTETRKCSPTTISNGRISS